MGAFVALILIGAVWFFKVTLFDSDGDRRNKQLVAELEELGDGTYARLEFEIAKKKYKEMIANKTGGVDDEYIKKLPFMKEYAKVVQEYKFQHRRLGSKNEGDTWKLNTDTSKIKELEKQRCLLKGQMGVSCFDNTPRDEKIYHFGKPCGENFGYKVVNVYNKALEYASEEVERRGFKSVFSLKEKKVSPYDGSVYWVNKARIFYPTSYTNDGDLYTLDLYDDLLFDLEGDTDDETTRELRKLDCNYRLDVAEDRHCADWNDIHPKHFPPLDPDTVMSAPKTHAADNVRNANTVLKGMGIAGIIFIIFLFIYAAGNA